LETGGKPPVTPPNSRTAAGPQRGATAARDPAEYSRVARCTRSAGEHPRSLTSAKGAEVSPGTAGGTCGLHIVLVDCACAQQCYAWQSVRRRRLRAGVLRRAISSTIGPPPVQRNECRVPFARGGRNSQGCRAASKARGPFINRAWRCGHARRRIRTHEVRGHRHGLSDGPHCQRSLLQRSNTEAHHSGEISPSIQRAISARPYWRAQPPPARPQGAVQPLGQQQTQRGVTHRPGNSQVDECLSPGRCVTPR
jgi:hypothetical protein